jgi:ATP-dependent DNA helicase RecG
VAESSNTKKTKPAPLAERFKKLGLVREWDFLLHLPLRYEDRTQITEIAHIPEGGDVQVAGTVIECTAASFPYKKLDALVEDDTGCCRVFFRTFYPSTVQMMEVGSEVLLFGRARMGRKYFEFFHPKVKKNTHEELPRTLDPIYPATQSIQQHTIRNRIKRALMDVTVKELLTEEEKAPLAMPDLGAALRSIHRPSVDDDFEALLAKRSPAWQRLKFDECFAQQLLLRRARALKQSSEASALSVRHSETSVLTRLISALPFELTQGQKRAWREVVEDLGKTEPMNRLVQGDVGCGKTVIAALAAALAIDNDKQVAFMAPTEILAAQHYERVSEWFRGMPVKIVFLSGKLTDKEKREVKSAIAGDAQIVIGTHALVEPTVAFRDLALAIVDEQHRFGVMQRLALRSSAEKKTLPHLLMMSATPIPRSLAMTYLADLSVSIIDELPAGRRPVKTLLTPSLRKAELLASLARKLAAGAQVYWVCPLVNASEKIDLANAEERFEELRKYFKDFEVGLLHGQMGADEKAEVMRRFAAGEVRLMVSTTVIEVGVDVKNATVMVIEQPERFGLAQLHQLRGRVGRGSEESFCIGLYGAGLSAAAQQRLEIFRSTTDGFVIAEADLKMRGPGDFLGARQSGSPLLRFSDVTETNTLINYAVKLAEDWVQRGDERITQQIRRWFSEEENFLDA